MTGAAGSIGSEFMKQLGHHAVAVDHTEKGLFDLGKGARRCIGDIRQPDFIAKHRPQIVIHCAAMKHVDFAEDNVAAVIDVNINGTKALLDACAANGVEQFFFISTDKAANPIATMGLTKALGERLVMSYRDFFKTTVARFGNVLGSSGSVHEIFARQTKEGKRLTVTHPDCKRYFIKVEEAVKRSIEAFELDSGVYLFDMGEMVSIYGIAQMYTDAIDIIGLRPGEKIIEDLISIDESLEPTDNPNIRRIVNGFHSKNTQRPKDGRNP